MTFFNEEICITEKKKKNFHLSVCFSFGVLSAVGLCAFGLSSEFTHAGKPKGPPHQAALVYGTIAEEMSAVMSADIDEASRHHRDVFDEGETFCLIQDYMPWRPAIVGSSMWSGFDGARNITRNSTSIIGNGSQKSRSDDTVYAVRGGGDVVINMDDGRGCVAGSLFAHYGASDAVVRREGKNIGNLDAELYGGGLGLVFNVRNGMFLSLGTMLSHMDFDVRTAEDGDNKTDANIFSFSTQGGWRFDVSDHLSVVPFMQMSVHAGNINDFTNRNGDIVAFERTNNMIGKVGLAVEGDISAGELEMRFNSKFVGMTEFLQNSEFSVAEERYRNRKDPEMFDASFGLSIQDLLLDRTQIFMGGGYSAAFYGNSGRDTLRGNVGMRFRF